MRRYRNAARPARPLVALALLFGIWPIVGLALDPPYLDSWPTVDRVLAEHQGKDTNDTLAVQMAALHVMRDAVEYAAGSRRWHGLTADEQRLRGEYYVAAEHIRDQVNSTLPNQLGPGFHWPWEEAPLQAWYGQQWDYEGNYQFREATLHRYLPAAVITQVLAETPPSISRPQGGEHGQRKGMPVIAIAIGAILLLLFIVRLLRRSARRRGEQAVADSETPAKWIPEGYSELTPAQKQELAAAGKEVLDSLEPYMLAAKPEGRPFPINVLLDEQIDAFLFLYCDRALNVIRGVDSENKQATRECALVMFHLWFAETERMKRLFGGDASPKIVRSKGKDHDRKQFLGGLKAVLVLKIFADMSPASNVTEPTDEKLSGLRLPVDPPPTRLHPRGPNAARAQREVLSYFSKRLLELAAKA